jgi:hypothetical protein
MGIIYPGDAFNNRNQVTRDNRIKVYRANQVHTAEQQEKQEPEIIFQVEGLTPGEYTPYPVMQKRMSRDGRGIR